MRAFALLAACAAATSACVVEHDLFGAPGHEGHADDDGHDHGPPIDLQDNLHQQGIIDCTERQDTGYVSGSSFSITVVTVDGKPVERDTANAYFVMQQAAAQDGVYLRVVSGFRTYEQQQYFYGCYVNCNCNGCNLAARPGYSNHQSGHALDLNTAEAGVLTWLNAHGAAYGFSRTVPSESWHWEWWGGGPGGGPCGAPPPPPTECQTGDYAGAFCDDEGSAHEDEHDCVAEAGVMGRCKLVDGSPAFCGGDHVTRAKTAQVLMNLAGVTNPEQFPDAFADDDGHPLEKWLNAARHHGVIFGDGANVVPDGIATRTTVAVMLSRLYALPPPTQSWFSDDDGTGAEPWHDQMKEAGLMTGYGDGTFRGGEDANRNTLAVVGCRALGAGLVPNWQQTTPAPEEPGESTTTEPPPVTENPEAPREDRLGDLDDLVAQPETEPAPVEDDSIGSDEELPPSVVGGCAAAGGSTTAASIALLALLRARPRRRARTRTAGSG